MTNSEPDFETIQLVAPRDVWGNEPSGFTPWLINHIDELSRVLGISLEFVQREAHAGRFKLDILAKDENGNYVAIENQIEAADHIHLGQSITYASWFGASTVVWIAKEFTDEHRIALDWLNKHCKGISYYGVQIEVIRIGDSKNAPQFKVISQPNPAESLPQELTGIAQFQLSFWERFREKLPQKLRQDIANRLARPQTWYEMTLGRAGVSVETRCNKGANRVGVRFYVYSYASEIFTDLEERKSEIESAIGDTLEWDSDHEGKTISRFMEFDLSDESQREKALDWLVEMTIKFESVFRKQIANLS